MSEKSGFTLIEMVVVIVILAILAALAIPSYLTNQMQGATKAAQNNLITIYNAEKNFYLSNTFNVGGGAPPYYCSTTTQFATCASNLTNINTNLSLNINNAGGANNDGYFSYTCTDPSSGTDGNDGSTFSCTATNLTNALFTLTVTNNPIVLPGGVGAANPSCVDAAHPNYCPSLTN
jgi:prepilin-type N-terminal cleavage/methylation domain-containing protein